MPPEGLLVRSRIGVWMAIAGFVVGSSVKAQPLSVLIVGGQDGQDGWRYTSSVHAETLEATGRFDAQVVAADIAPQHMDARDYSLVVIDATASSLEGPEIVPLDPQRASQAPSLRRRLLSIVERGGGVLFLSRAAEARPVAGFEALGFVREQLPEDRARGTLRIYGPGADHAIWSGIAGFELQDAILPVRRHPAAQAFARADTPGGESIMVGVAARIGRGRAALISIGSVTPQDPSSKRGVLSPGFRALLSRAAEWAATGVVTLPAEWTDTLPHNELSEGARAQGWKLLFDGKSMSQFRGFKAEQEPSRGWTVVNGTLHHAAGGGGGDIITREQFSDFVLSLQWKVASAGNSGIIYRCTEDHDWTWETGMEMQILDDAAHPDARRPRTSAGALYDVVAPSSDVVRPAGEWNSARIVARGTHIEHWLNGVKVVDIDTAGAAYLTARRQSKWNKVPTMGSVPSGHIALQDHGDAVWFRDIMIRELH